MEPPPEDEAADWRPPSPREISCTECGVGATSCSSCGGTGMVPIQGCPRKFVTRDVHEAIYWVHEIDEHGTWPLGAGPLHHTECFLEAVKQIRSEEALLKAQQKE